MSHRIFAFVLATSWATACTSKDAPSEDVSKQASPSPDAAVGEATQKPSLPAAEDLLTRAVEASGGKAAVEGVHSYHTESEISIIGQAIRGRMELWWKDGDFYTVQEIPGIGIIEAGKSGEQVWSRDPITGLRELEGVEAEQHHWASSFLLPADWKTYFATAETVGERKIEDHDVYDVVLTSSSGAQLQLSLDRDSGLPIEQKLEQVSALGNAPVVTRLDDYRTVDGIKIAFKQVTETSVAKALQQTHTLKLNAKIDTGKFTMPHRGEAVIDAKAMDKPTAMPFAEDGKPGRPVPR